MIANACVCVYGSVCSLVHKEVTVVVTSNECVYAYVRRTYEYVVRCLQQLISTHVGPSRQVL